MFTVSRPYEESGSLFASFSSSFFFGTSLPSLCPPGHNIIPVYHQALVLLPFLPEALCPSPSSNLFLLPSSFCFIFQLIPCPLWAPTLLSQLPCYITSFFPLHLISPICFPFFMFLFFLPLHPVFILFLLFVVVNSFPHCVSFFSLILIFFCWFPASTKPSNCCWLAYYPWTVARYCNSTSKIRLLTEVFGYFQCKTSCGHKISLLFFSFHCPSFQPSALVVSSCSYSLFLLCDLNTKHNLVVILPKSSPLTVTGSHWLYWFSVITSQLSLWHLKLSHSFSWMIFSSITGGWFHTAPGQHSVTVTVVSRASMRHCDWINSYTVTLTHVVPYWKRRDSLFYWCSVLLMSKHVYEVKYWHNRKMTLFSDLCFCCLFSICWWQRTFHICVEQTDIIIYCSITVFYSPFVIYCVNICKHFLCYCTRNQIPDWADSISVL